MEIRKKTGFRSCIICVLVLLVIICGIVLYFLPALMIGSGLPLRYSCKKKIIGEFEKNYKQLSGVSEYLLSAEYNTIVIRNSDYIYDDGDYGCWYVSEGYDENAESGTIEINDSDFVNTLDYLFSSRKYEVIERDGAQLNFSFGQISTAARA